MFFTTPHSTTLCLRHQHSFLICSDESHLLHQGFDESKGCPLGAAQQMVGRITETIGREHSDKVSMQKGHVDSLSLRNGLWQINGGHAVAERVFLAPGAHPKTDSQHGAKALDLDDCLKPSKLSGACPSMAAPGCP